MSSLWLTNPCRTCNAFPIKRKLDKKKERKKERKIYWPESDELSAIYMVITDIIYMIQLLFQQNLQNCTGDHELNKRSRIKVDWKSAKSQRSQKIIRAKIDNIIV